MTKPQTYEIKNLPRRSLSSIVTLRKARKEHRCQVCPDPIVKGQEYCEITDGGSGLGGLKFPDRCHPECIDDYLERRKVNDN